LGNCPFHHLAQGHTDLICGMNLHLVRGLLAGLPSASYAARLEPTPGNCCVVLDPT
jgi:predicted ArsR family transcriptional regulator